MLKFLMNKIEKHMIRCVIQRQRSENCEKESRNNKNSKQNKTQQQDEGYL